MCLRETEQVKIVIDSLKAHIKMRKEILSEEEQAVRKYVLKFYYDYTRFPLLAEISSYMNVTTQRIEAIVKTLDRYDAIKLDSEGARILISYPFSENKTDYSVYIQGTDNMQTRHLYANCAIDSLGIPFMFNCNVKINAKTALFKKDIEISVINQKIEYCEPNGVIVFAGTKYCSKAANSCCGSIIFFANEDELSVWREQNIAREGEKLSLDEALYVGKILFQNRINDAEV